VPAARSTSTCPSGRRNVERARHAFAKLIGAKDDEVAVQSNASTAISAVVSTLRLGVRDAIATTALDFPTAPYIAQRQRERGFRHVYGARLPEVGATTALACLPVVVSFQGERLDVAGFTRSAHNQGALVLADAFQALGTQPIDVRKLDVDFLVSGVYKWLMGASGLAFLYVKREHHGRVPMSGGWLAGADPYSFDPLQEPAPDARRYQYGGPSAIACAGLPASISLLDDIGLGAIEKHNAALVGEIVRRADECKWEVPTPRDPGRRGSIVTIRPPDVERALAACAREKVAVSPRMGGIRVSPHFYNDITDVDLLFEVLDRAK
jgi:selenocysteine lyase/cysteine desulfurase